MIPPNPLIDHKGRICMDLVQRVQLSKPLK